MKYTIEVEELKEGNPKFQVTQNVATKRINICYNYHEDINEPILVEVPVNVVIVCHNPLHKGVKTTEGFAPRTLIDKLVKGELKIGDEIFPDYKGFGERLQDINDFGIPTSVKDLIDLANKYNTPIPNLNINE